MKAYERIGHRLREARERMGMTQEQAARAVGILREQLSYFETGKRAIDLVTLIRLSELYGYAIGHFLAAPAKDRDLPTVCFRAEELNEADNAVLAWLQRFARNLHMLNGLLGEAGPHE